MPSLVDLLARLIRWISFTIIRYYESSFLLPTGGIAFFYGSVYDKPHHANMPIAF